MPAYLIARVNVTDPERYKLYAARTPAAVARFGGRFLVRGGDKETLEGPQETSRVVVIEFPSLARGREFFRSPEYEEIKKLRLGAADGQFLLIDGYAPAPTTGEATVAPARR